MIDLQAGIAENALILIPALMVVGKIMKSIAVIPDKWIPLLLLPFGIAGALAICGPCADSVAQGVLITGTAVYGHQIYKQMSTTT